MGGEPCFKAPRCLRVEHLDACEAFIQRKRFEVRGVAESRAGLKNTDTSDGNALDTPILGRIDVRLKGAVYEESRATPVAKDSALRECHAASTRHPCPASHATDGAQCARC